MPTNTHAAELAASMNCSVSQLMAMARGVADFIEQNKASAHFIAADEATQTALASAYLPVYVRKVEAIQMACLTRPQLKNDMCLAVLTMLQLQAA